MPSSAFTVDADVLRPNAQPESALALDMALCLRRITNVVKVKHAICCGLSLLFLVPSVGLGQTAALAPDQQLQSLTQQILAEEIALQRLNVHYRLETAVPSKLRPWRQLAYAEANSNLTLSGLLPQMVERFGAMSKPGEVESVTVKNHKDIITLKRGTAKRIPGSDSIDNNVLRMIGSGISGSGDIFELCLNGVKDLRLIRHGFDPKSYRLKVAAIREHLDKLIAQRQAAAEQIRQTVSAQDAELMDGEGKVLKDIRDLCMLDYIDFYADARRVRYLEDAAYLWDLGGCVTSVASNIVAIEGVHLKRTRWSGGANVLTIIAGVFTLLTPVFGRVSGNFAGIVARKTASEKELHLTALSADVFYRDRLALDDALLRHAVGDIPAGVSNRRSIYEKEQNILEERGIQISSRAREAHSTLMENIVYANIVGNTKIAFGITTTDAFWREWNTPWIANRLVAAGTTAYAAGAAFAIIENARVRIQKQKSDNAKAKQGMTFGQVLARRLDTLDKMDQFNSLRRNSSN